MELVLLGRWTETDGHWPKRKVQRPEIDEVVAEIKSSFQEAREAIEHARRMEKLAWRCFIGSGVAGVGLGLYAFAYVARKAAEAARR
uniref:Uncharacterized protein n=1 Tax=Setaria viridis TaxID=4556 RepID=A0A4U6VYW6_SETVI|nr:hypothetical protein SEVIR_2G022400v2 [Setaria viridis]